MDGYFRNISEVQAPQKYPNNHASCFEIHEIYSAFGPPNPTFKIKVLSLKDIC